MTQMLQTGMRWRFEPVFRKTGLKRQVGQSLVVAQKAVASAVAKEPANYSLPRKGNHKVLPQQKKQDTLLKECPVAIVDLTRSCLMLRLR
ncbi:hypothetical protein TH63_16965 [Rufibacter radiotolerans]|uniref:Uncharacterized protein n=1 Tax=Rufibacter radiotolerans TaxID=1379910 RepID=A0A0H4VT18_9BACT|nr:hypothetical protein TH63_16965 [Rufibacter radiotolerans]